MANMATVEEAREALERAEKATPGHLWGGLNGKMVLVPDEEMEANRQLVLHARTDVPKLANTVIAQADIFKVGGSRKQGLEQLRAASDLLIGMKGEVHYGLGQVLRGIYERAREVVGQKSEA